MQCFQRPQRHQGSGGSSLQPGPQHGLRSSSGSSSAPSLSDVPARPAAAAAAAPLALRVLLRANMSTGGLPVQTQTTQKRWKRKEKAETFPQIHQSAHQEAHHNVTKDRIKLMIDMSGERMHPHLSKDNTYMELENPNEVEKALSTWMEDKSMLRRARPPLCWSPGLGQLHRQFQSVVSGECDYHLPHGTGHSHGWGEGRFPLGTGPLCKGEPAPPAAHQRSHSSSDSSLKAGPLKSCPCDLLPIQHTLVTFLAEGVLPGKKSLTWGGQASKVKQPTEIFPLLAWFGLLASCWFGVVLITMTSSFLASKTTHF